MLFHLKISLSISCGQHIPPAPCFTRVVNYHLSFMIIGIHLYDTTVYISINHTKFTSSKPSPLCHPFSLIPAILSVSAAKIFGILCNGNISTFLSKEYSCVCELVKFLLPGCHLVSRLKYQSSKLHLHITFITSQSIYIKCECICLINGVHSLHVDIGVTLTKHQ